MANYTILPGISSNGIILDDGRLIVSSGGTANSTTVNSDGSMYVSRGGTANNTTVYFYGYLHVFSGGTANSTTVSGGSLEVYSGGTANSTTVIDRGDLFVFDGGTANSTTVSGGHLYVSSGGTATDVVWRPCEGLVTVEVGAHVTFASQYSGVYYGSNNQLLSNAAVMEKKELACAYEMFVMTGGTANSTTVNSRGYLYVSSGGTVNSTTVNSRGYLYVSSGGTANGTIANEGGCMCICSGGTANSTTVNSSGYLYVSSGGTVNSTTVNSRGYLYVSSGGTANSTTVSGGYLYVSSGGTANSTTVNSYGSLCISNGGTATEILENGGYVVFAGDAEVSFASNTINGLVLSSASATVHSGTTANNTTVNSGGYLYVYSGGTATEIVENGGYVVFAGDAEVSFASNTINGLVLSSAAATVHSGTTANNTTVNYGGGLYVSSGGTANNTTINTSGCLYVYSGGIANSTAVNGGGRIVAGVRIAGYMYVSSGGTANSTTVNSCGSLCISSGGTATEIVENGGYVVFADDAEVSFASNTFNGLVLSSASATVHSGTTANNTTVNSKGYLYVSSGGTANNTTLNTSGCLYVYSGGIANSTTVNSSGCLYVSSGGTANNTTVNSKGYLYVSSGGTVNSTTVSGGNLYVYSGGTANSTTVYYGAFTINHGGTANSTTVSGGYLYVYSGGTANSTTVNGNGHLYVYSGGTASIVFNPFSGQITSDTGAVVTYFEREADVYYGNGASGTVSSANTMTGLAIASGFSAVVFQGGRLESATAQEGYLHVSGGGIANDITMNKGYVYVYGGGKLTGRMTFNGDAFVSACTGAILDFDLTQTSAGATALLNDLSCVQGTPTYTLTVNGTESSGTYSLADGVSFFGGVISVIKTSGEQLGSLMVGQKLETEYADYALKVSNSSLTLTVTASGTVPPAGDTTPPSDPTGLDTVVSGQKVALVWNVSSDDTGVKEYVVRYLLDGQEYTVRTDGTSYVLSNADAGSYSWSVQAVDFAGNESGITAGDAFTVSVSEFRPYTVEYSADNFEHTIRFTVTSPALNTFHMPGGTYQMRVRQEGSSEWQTGDPIVAEAFDDTPQLIKSDADGNADVFFVNASDTWKTGYVAQHAGSVNDWSGTGEYAALFGKNKLTDIFEGSTDANILLMTDDDNGDALFVDDIYSDSPDKLGLSQSRIAQIDEIRAGAGNDIVDMTSQRFEYIGDGLTIRGGDGDDVIWTNKGDNRLFGDAGNDRIAGASGNDVIAGGSGNDRMHGGGGNDVFTFCDNWGVDNVEQLASGSVTLWFASGSEANWNAETLTCTDGENSVKVSGVTADRITLKFGDDGSAQFASLSGMGAFFDATSERIFEESGKGILASL